MLWLIEIGKKKQYFIVNKFHYSYLIRFRLYLPGSYYVNVHCERGIRIGYYQVRVLCKEILSSYEKTVSELNWFKQILTVKTTFFVTNYH